MMRVIAGLYRGRTLATPKGDEVTRPTTDRVRESLMSTLISARGGLEGAVVLDAFAGSGALGVEALSRGARFALLCDRDREALKACAANTSFVDPASVKVVRADVTRFVPACPAGPFDLVFLDPPYAYGADEAAGIVARLDEAGQLAPGALVVYEHAKNGGADALEAFDGLQLGLYTQKSYGKKTAVDIFRKDAQ